MKNVVVLGILTLAVCCRAADGRTIQEGTNERSSVESQFDSTKSPSDHKAERDLRTFLKDLAANVYSNGDLAWTDGRIIHFDHPEGFKYSEEDAKAWKRRAASTAECRKLDFKGDFARVLWVERHSNQDDVYCLFLHFQDEKWRLVGNTLYRDSGVTWKQFFVRLCGSLAIGRMKLEKKGKVPESTKWYSNEEITRLVGIVEELSFKDKMIPVGLWVDLLYSDSPEIRAHGSERLSKHCKVKIDPLKDSSKHDQWLQSIAKQILEAYPGQFKLGLLPETEVPLAGVDK